MTDFQQFLSGLNGKREFSHLEKSQVWSKAFVVPGFDMNIIRKDSCGAWIKWADYGNTNSSYGWEIDHVYPASLGGSNNLANLQPLQWQNNRAKGDSTAGYMCAVKAVV